MFPVFEKEFALRTSDYDSQRILRPFCLFDLFQSVAGEHANALGCGFEDMLKKNLLWVVVRTKFERLNHPDMFQTVRVKTWPLPPSRLSFQREYLITDTNATPIAKGSSEWVAIDIHTRKIAVAKDVYPPLPFLEEKMFEGRLRKISDFVPAQEGYTLVPGASHTDMNNHVNNARYVDYVQDALGLPAGKMITAMQLDFRHEVTVGTPLTLHRLQEDETHWLCKGVNAQGETMFACSIETNG